ncbi:MAG TPA: hypothetical protein VK921_00015 [Anditalea sp.]|nr:hypothetical protein [Anditalea sp.]
MKNFYLLILFCCGIFSACAPTRFVKPLEENQWAVTGSIGGPLVDFEGTTIPLPFTSMGLGYGMTDATTAFGNIHTTALAFGVLHIEAGVLQSIVEPEGIRPGLSAGGSLNFMGDMWWGNMKLFPQIDANLYWNYGYQDNFFYLGTSNWMDLSREKAHGETQQNKWIFNLQAGHTFSGEKWDFVLEAKYLAPFHSNQNIVVDYTSFSNQGAIGAYFGIIRKF